MGKAPAWLFRAKPRRHPCPGKAPACLLRGNAPVSSQPGASPQEMDSKRYSAPTARPISNAADVPACGMMDRADGPWWLLRMVSWGDAPGWDGIGPLARKTSGHWPARHRPVGPQDIGQLARKNPPASRAIWIVRPSSARPGISPAASRVCGLPGCGYGGGGRLRRRRGRC
jgi:hypothetical protein